MSKTTEDDMIGTERDGNEDEAQVEVVHPSNTINSSAGSSQLPLEHRPIFIQAKWKEKIAATAVFHCSYSYLRVVWTSQA